jgi:NAD-dependent dihydropyrimidine dehydrogenase PreA subunit
MNAAPTILFCHCAGARTLPEATRAGLAAALAAEPGLDVRHTPDLCRLAAARDPLLREVAAAPALVVLACQPRAVRWLFAAAGAPLDPARARSLNLRRQPLADLLAAAVPGGLAAPPAEGAEVPAPPPAAPGWPPWFPVIDGDRCRHCRQCFNFCLFGVYAVSAEGRVEVRNPQQCKNNCPACARICPELAILFPKHAEPPIDGAAIEDEAAARARVRLSLETMFAGDVRKGLAARQAQARRLRLVRERELRKAEAERRRHLGSDAAPAPGSGG